ncbi:MAG: flap endonuclease-1 [Nanoarchaeota archaeon]
MGLQLKDLVVKREVSLADLKGKVLAVDSYNYLYQFLTTIRNVDGTVFTDRKGRVTSHLIGLFNRTTSLMEQGLKLVFVFDGKAPEIKLKTWEKRSAVKAEALLKLKEAEKEGDVEAMKRFASRTAILNKAMIEDAKLIIATLGLPVIQAPSEGEAQAAHLVKNGDAYACISQDYDNLIFGCPLLLRNLSLEGRRKKTGTLGYEKIKPELISLKEVLQHLGISHEQLLLLAILMGTDYNPGGIKGIGPKTALKLVKEHPQAGGGPGQAKSAERLFEQAGWSKHFPDLEWKEVYDTIKFMPVTDEYMLDWQPLDEKKLFHLLVEEYDFSAERVQSKLEKLKSGQTQLKQKGLKGFLG